MINDRGSIKWTTMMLPEHAELLKKLWNEDEKVKKPVLDVQEIEILEMQVNSAHQESAPVELTIYHASQFKRISGTITKLDEQSKSICLEDSFGELHHFPFHLIMNLTLKK